MYEFVLLVHSWVRWTAILAGVIAVILVYASPQMPSPTRADRWGLIFMITLDVQLLLGLLLYFALSPTTAAILKDFGAAMRDATARFWAVEHITMMLAAVVLVHVGRVLGRKATTPTAKRTRLLICFTLATILVLIGTPWPGMRAGRPFFRV
jgi:heme A synthase